MKTIIAILLAGFFCSSALQGQDKWKQHKFRQNSDTLYKQFPGMVIDSAKIAEFLKEHPQAFFQQQPNEFPGSSRYYAKRPLSGLTYEKSFIKEPDTNNKYYLIIKDPIRHTVTK